MDSKYVYVKQRRDFGKQCFFEDIGPTVEENIYPDPILNKEYEYQKITDRSTQKSKQFALHEIQTKDEKLKKSSMMHLEGSWPKEINPLDDVAVNRFRRRIIKSENYIATINSLMETMENALNVNSAVNIYDNYFDDLIPTELIVPSSIRIERVYSDQETNVRPVNHISWSMDTYRIAVAYCFKNRIELPSNLSPNAYIWDIELQNNPLVILKSASASVAIEFNPRDPFFLISGLMSGQVCSWDTRTSDSPVQISEAQNSHRNPANQALWINSKTNTEFFSASNSGTVKWWDTRNLRRPTENLVMDLANPERENINEAIGVSALQYESTMGSRFLVGLENGIVLNVNRRAISKTEKLYTRFYCHFGSVLTIDRHPGSLKNFLTVGDNHARVWAEDTKEHYLVQTGRKTLNFITGACWSRSRWSLFFTIDMDGKLDAYDLFDGTIVPYHQIPISEKPLTTIKPHDDGKIMAIGGSNGKVYLVGCEGLYTETFPKDKHFFTSYLDRCGQYEKLAEARKKETGIVVSTSALQITQPISKHKYRNKSKDKSKDKDIREKFKLKEREKSKDLTRKSRPKKSFYYRGSADEYEMHEADRHFFFTMTTEKESYDSEEMETIERLHAINVRASEAKLKLQKIDIGERFRRKPKPRRMKEWIKSTSSLKIPDSFEEIVAKVEMESVKPEEIVERKRRRKRRTRSESPLMICPMGVCEPEICCADVAETEKERKTLGIGKEMKEKKFTRFIGSSLEDGTSINRQKTLPSDWQKKMKKRKMLWGKDDGAPNDILKEDVKEAKKYLEAWRESLRVKKYSSTLRSFRSLSMPPMRILKDEKSNDQDDDDDDEEKNNDNDNDEQEKNNLKKDASVNEDIKGKEDEGLLYPRISDYCTQ